MIEVPGYTVEEKVEIAKRHLLPKQLEMHGLGPDQLQIPQPSLALVGELLECVWCVRAYGVCVCVCGVCVCVCVWCVCVCVVYVCMVCVRMVCA